MAERLLEYVALLPGELRRSGWMAAEGGRVVTHVPLVAYNGRAKWNAPLRLDERAWAPSQLRDLQPRLRCRLIDAKNYAGDDAADGNLARAVLALDAAPAQGLVPALERAVALLSTTDDQELWRSFVAWCGGTLSPQLGGQMPALVENKETTMLAETLREWDEQKIAEGRLVGRQRAGSRAARRAGGRGAKRAGGRCWRRNGRCCAAWPAGASAQLPVPSWRRFSLASRTLRNWRGSAR